MFLLVFAVLAACDPADDSGSQMRPDVFVLSEIDPDLTDSADPKPGQIVWVSTRAGEAQISTDGRELEELRVDVDPAEIQFTTLPVEHLIPGFNDVEILLTIDEQANDPISAWARVFVDAECIDGDDCTSGACLSFLCQ